MRSTQGNWLQHQWRVLRTGVLFLTCLPVGKMDPYQPGWLQESLIYFPLIGAMVGACCASTAWIFWAHFPPVLVVLAALLCGVLITGALHEDGLADAADGLLGGRTPERRLEIMKDSRIGTFGALALGFCLATKLFCLQDLAIINFSILLRILVAAHLLSRISAVVLLYALPYTQPEQSKGGAVGQPSPIVLLICLAIGAVSAAALLGPRLGVACLVCLLIVCACFGTYLRFRIRGVSGDCLGAGIQLVETGCYLTAVFQTGIR